MRNQLINRLSINDIYSLCLQTQGKENNCLKEELYQLTFDENERVAFNALWALSHFDEANNEWLYAKHDDLIDRILLEKSMTKLRLMLSLLIRQPFEEATPFRLHRLLHSQDYRVLLSVCHPCLLHEACLRADEILSRAPYRVEGCIRYARTRSLVARLGICQATGDEED